MTVKNIVIAGFGDIGHRLINGSNTVNMGDGLLNAHYYGIKRSAPREALVEDLKVIASRSTTIIQADLAEMAEQDKAALAQLPSTIDCLIYTLTPSQMDEVGYRTAYIDCYSNLMAALRDNAITVKCLIYVSSTGVYGQTQHEWVDETSVTEPKSFSGKILVEAEKLALSQSKNHHCLRFSGIYGRSDASISSNRYIRQIHAGQFYAQEPAHYSNRIHIDDVVGVLSFLVNKLLLTSKDENVLENISDNNIMPLAPIILASDNEAASLFDIQQWLYGFVQKTNASDTVHETIPPPGRTGSKRCDNSYLRSLGYVFSKPTYKQGFEDLVKQIT